MTPDDLMQEIGKARVTFWTCLNRDHSGTATVSWADGVATCGTCGLTSTMTSRWTDLVREHERERIAKAGLVVVSADDLRSAVEVLATVNDPWRYISEEPELEARLRAALPEKESR